MTTYLISDFPDVLASRDLQVEIDTLKQLDQTAIIQQYAYQNQDELLAKLEQTDVLITAFLPINAELISKLTRLKGIAVNATGTSTIDLEAAAKKGITVQPLIDYATEDVANHTMALMLALNQKLPEHTKNINSHIWRYEAVGTVTRLGSQTLAILGFGRIGQAVAKRAKAFGMTVVAVDPHIPKSVAEAQEVELVSIPEAAEKADVMSLHLFAAADAPSLCDETFFKQLKKQPLSINVARGTLVDENALVNALDTGKISGAGLDVLASESPDLVNLPLIGRDNVILSPHAAFYSQESLTYLQLKTVENAVAIAEGAKTCLNKSRENHKQSK